MFSNLGWPEIALLAVVALFVFGPDRLPKVASDAARMLRQLRAMAQSATSELKTELGPEMADLDLSSLHPKRFVAQHLFGEGDSRPGDGAAGAGTPVPAAERSAPLPSGATPPYDVDAT